MWGSFVISCCLGSHCSYWTRRRTDQQDPAGVGMQDPDSCRWDHLQWSSTRSCKVHNQPGCPSHKGDTCFHSWLYQRDDAALGRSLPSLIPMELAQWWMKQKTLDFWGWEKCFQNGGPKTAWVLPDSRDRFRDRSCGFVTLLTADLGRAAANSDWRGGSRKF